MKDHQKEKSRLEEADGHYSKFLKALLEMSATEDGEPTESWCIQAKEGSQQTKSAIEELAYLDMTPEE